MKLTTQLAADLGPGVESRLPADRVLEGDPVFTSWNTDHGAISTGIWCSTPGAQTMARDARTWEHFHILQGEIEICSAEGLCQRFGPGDSGSIPPGFKGVWRTLSPVRKTYVTLRAASVPALLQG